MEWLMMILLVAGFGKDKTPVVIHGETVYPSEDACKEQAKILLNWLHQDGVKVFYRCYPRLKVAGGVE